MVPEKSKIIEPLPRIDHSTIEYESFEKNFYDEHDEIKSMNVEQVEELRKTLGIRVINKIIWRIFLKVLF